MNKVVEEILWRIYCATSDRVGGRNDIRFVLLNSIIKDARSFTGKQLNKAVYELTRQKLIKKKEYENSVLVSMSERGILRMINYKFRRLNDKKEKWDNKWRMITFDIPNSYEKARKALVYRLKMGGFYEWQKSVFLYPYDCREEVSGFTRLFKIEKYVHFGLVEFIDDQNKLEFHFKLE